MKRFLALSFPLLIAVCAFSGCKKKETFTAEEIAAAAKLKPTKDPVKEEIYAFRIAVRQDYNSRRFAELEKRATELRRSKAVFGNGSWKLSEFYDSFPCRSDEPESMWQLHDRIHRDWIAAFPQSVTARVAYADFFVSYAWHARGSGFAKTVTAEGWRLFRERIEAARRTLEEARQLPERDPIWWSVVLQIARAQGWSKDEYDRTVDAAQSFQSKFWEYDVSRAVSLLPRWYGKPGDWEGYAEQAAARPDGLGDEIYARIVMALHGYYTNVFRETTASWEKARAGLERMRQLYPRSLDILSEAAKLAVQAEDRELAGEMFVQLADRYLSSVWQKPEYFVRYRKWAGVSDIAPVADENTKLAARQKTAPATGSLVSPVASVTPPPHVSTAWSAKTVRAIRAKADRRAIVIPKNVQLRVIARSGADVMVSYKGSTVTIPLSATDLK